MKSVPDTAVNVVARASQWAKLRTSREGSAAQFAAELGVSAATLSLHLKILREVDSSIIHYLTQCEEDHTHRWFSLRELVKLAKMPADRQRDVFKQGLEQAANQNPERN